MADFRTPEDIIGGMKDKVPDPRKFLLPIIGIAVVLGILFTSVYSIGPDEVGDPSWGFKFLPPAGWVHQQSGEGVIMGHNTIAGMILVIPHISENMTQMQKEMIHGKQEVLTYLS